MHLGKSPVLCSASVTLWIVITNGQRECDRPSRVILYIVDLYLWFHSGVPPYVISYPEFKVAHAGYWVKDMIGVASIERIGEIFQLAVYVGP